MTPLVSLGSRSGSAFALAMFVVLFGAIGLLAARRLARRIPPIGAIWPRLAAAALVVGPAVLLYATSLSGFYDIEVSDDQWRLRYLLPPVATTIPEDEVQAVEAVPLYRGTWTLHIVTAHGRYESATGNRAAVDQARLRLMQWQSSRR